MSVFNLPDQTIPETQKTKTWHMEHAIQQAVATTESSNINTQHKLILKLYRAYYGELSPEEEALTKMITCPHGTDLGIPYTVYPLIRSKIEQILGEYYIRPMKRKIYALDKHSKNSKLEEMLKMQAEEIMRELKEEMKNDLGFEVQTENPDMEIPEDIEEHFETNFKSLAEQTGQLLVDFLLKARKEEKKFKEIFINYCITDRCHAFVDDREKHVTLRNVHPLDANFDLDPYKNVQDNHEFFFENYWLTENEIYNIFNLDKETKTKVKELFAGFANQNNYSENTFDKEELSSTVIDGAWYQTTNKTNRLRVVYGIWKSRKIIRYKKSIDNFQNTHYKKLKDDDKVKEKDEIKQIDLENPRFVIQLGPEICLDYGECKERFSPKDNQYICRLPVVTLIRENNTGSSQIKSLAALLLPLQEMASEVLYEIRLALRNAGDSRVMVYDVAQTPKALNKGSVTNSINRVMHHIKKDKMMFINSAERGAKNTFNQFTSLDISQQKGIAQLFEGLSIIEDLADKFTGIYPEREGKVGQYQSATGTERAIRGSTARTEVYFNPFDDFVQEVIGRMLMKSKHFYKEGEVIEYIIGNMKTKFLRLYKEFFDADLGIYISDARRDQDVATAIDAAAQQSLSNASAPDIILGLIDVLEGESASEKKKIFQKMLDKMEDIRQESIKMQQEQEQARLADEKEEKDIDTMLTREGHQKDVIVAEIYKDGKIDEQNINNLSKEKIKAAELLEKRNENSQQ